MYTPVSATAQALLTPDHLTFQSTARLPLSFMLNQSKPVKQNFTSTTNTGQTTIKQTIQGGSEVYYYIIHNLPNETSQIMSNKPGYIYTARQ